MRLYWPVSERGRLVIVIVRTHADVLHCGNNSHGRGGSQRRSLRAAAGCACHHEPRNSTQLSDRRAARSGRLRPGLSGTATRTIERGARGPVHQGQPAHRRMAARGLFRPATRRSPSRDSRLRRVSSHVPRGDRSCTALRSSTRSTEISARSSSATIARGRNQSRVVKSPASSRCSESCTAGRCSTAI